MSITGITVVLVCLLVIESAILCLVAIWGKDRSEDAAFWKQHWLESHQIAKRAAEIVEEATRG